MSVKIIIEQFDILNGIDVSTRSIYKAILGVPSFQIRFYVKSPYFS